MKDQAMEVISRATSATKDVSRRAAGAVGDAYRASVATGAEWEESLENYVHEKPLQAVLIAAGVGVLLGLLWKRS